MADVSGTTGSSDAQLQDMKRKDAGSEEKKEDREIESVTIHQPPSISAKVEKPKKVEEEGEAEKSIQKTCHTLCQYSNLPMPLHYWPLCAFLMHFQLLRVRGGQE